MRKRDFLKLLGLAPVAVPLAAKEAVAPKYAMGGHIDAFAMAPGERLWWRPYSRFPNEFSFRDWSDPGLVLRTDASYRDVPNRLFGAFIKPDGDVA